MDTRTGDGEPEAIGGPFISLPGNEAYDSLADLFLGNGPFAPEPFTTAAPRPRPINGAPLPAARDTGPSAESEAVLEAVILGHLPVLASPWVVQYAARRADEVGEPVVLLRLNSGYVSVEVLGAGASGEAQAPTLDDALSQARALTGRWLVRVDEIDEPMLAAAVAECAGTLTLLTGADDTAVVACYRTLKALADVLIGAGETLPRLRVAVMGASAEATASAGGKVRSAAETFLGMPPELAPPVSRMTPARALTLFRGRCESNPDALVRQVLATRPFTPDSPAPTPAEEPADKPRGAHPSPGKSPAVSLPGMGATNTLARLVEGLTPLQARCPYAEGVELAADGRGRVHLLACADTPEASTDAATRLLAASAWASAHADLLSAAEPVVRAGVGEPVMLLFTRAPRAVRRLLDGPVRVYALANTGDAMAAVEL